MTKCHRQLLMTTTFLVIATLAACGRPTLRTKDLNDSPATSANPAKAEKENRDADAAAAVDGTATEIAKDLGAAGPEIVDAIADARKAARAAALDEVAKLFADDRVSEAASKTATTAPEASQPEKPAKLEAVVEASGTTAVPPSAASVQFEAAVEVATKRVFVLSLIEPMMRLNNAIALQREEVLKLKKKLDTKQDLAGSEKVWLEKIKMDYGLVDSKATVEQLLERVDVVALSFLAAPLALKTGWGALGAIPKDLLSKRIEDLNTSLGDSKIRFRSARVVLRGGAAIGGGVELMRAFLGVSSEPQTPANELLLEATTEVARILAEPESAQEIERVRSDLVRENTPARLRN